MENIEALVALNMLDCVGPVKLRKLLERFGEPRAILQAERAQLESTPGIGVETAASIRRWETAVDLATEFKKIAAFGCRVVGSDDNEYPGMLREIYDPPIVLYVRGDLRACLSNPIAMVGSRTTTRYGTESARRLAHQLAYAGISVVSGGARGIDTASHYGVLNGCGRTVVVLGNGIDFTYPPENGALFDRVIENGALITQFPFGRRADRQTFPIRNRIVAGMTLGTVVVEANLSSGALITANFAADYGRQVFAVPGRIDSPRSKGCHELIKKGAKLCESAEDILSEFEDLFPPPERGSVLRKPECAPVLSESESKLYSYLGFEETAIDDLVVGCGLSVAEAASNLLSLELKRLIKQLPGKRFIRVR